MQRFYEYSFSTAVIDADTHIAKNFQRSTEHLLVSKNHSFDKETKSLTESPILKTHSIRGDSDKTALRRNSRRKVGNDQETKQQNCHITVYHSEL